MEKASLMVIAAFVLALAGIGLLWMMFFAKKSENGESRVGKVAKVQSLISQVEKENPELVEKIRSQLAANAMLKEAKNSEPGDVGNVVKQWLSNESDWKK